MSRPTAYARWLYAMTVARKKIGDIEFEGCEEILAHICVRSESNLPTKITTLVQSLLFGTGPTVHRKVSVLAERGLIDIVRCKTDGRASNLLLTKSGENLLKERTKQMALMLA